MQADSPEATLAIVPHLLGFVPRDSLIVIGVGPLNGRVKVTLRYDLPAAADRQDQPEPTAAANPGAVAEIASHAMSVLAAQSLTEAIVVGYGPDERVAPFVPALQEAAKAASVVLAEMLRVQDGRYWSYLCRDQECCPQTGTAFDPTAHAASIAMAEAGADVLADREAVGAAIAPLGGVTAESMRQATERAERYVTKKLVKVRKVTQLGVVRQMISAEGLAAVAEIIDTYRQGGRFSTDYQVAWLTVVLRDMRVRDDAWARMIPEHHDAHLRLWTDVVRRAQPGHVAPAASLLAFVAWQSGNGTLANLALDRALADNPRYSMATLLRQVISAGAPPSLARLPMTPDEVAASYAGIDAGFADGRVDEAAAYTTDIDDEIAAADDDLDEPDDDLDGDLDDPDDDLDDELDDDLDSCERTGGVEGIPSAANRQQRHGRL